MKIQHKKHMANENIKQQKEQMPLDERIHPENKDELDGNLMDVSWIKKCTDCNQTREEKCKLQELESAAGWTISRKSLVKLTMHEKTAEKNYRK